MEHIIKHIDHNMQEIYRKAVDADKDLKQLKQQGMAKFKHIFPQQTLFNCQQNHFMPYVSELATDIEQLKHSPQDQGLLLLITKKLALMHQTLSAFKQVTRTPSIE